MITAQGHFDGIDERNWAANDSCDPLRLATCKPARHDGRQFWRATVLGGRPTRMGQPVWRQDTSSWVGSGVPKRSGDHQWSTGSVQRCFTSCMACVLCAGVSERRIDRHSAEMTADLARVVIAIPSAQAYASLSRDYCRCLGLRYHGLSALSAQFCDAYRITFSLLIGVLLALVLYSRTNRWSRNRGSAEYVRRRRSNELIAEDGRQWSALRQLVSRYGQYPCPGA